MTVGRRAGWLLWPVLALVAAGGIAWQLNYRPWAPGIVRRLPPAETLVYLDLRPLRGRWAGMDWGGTRAGGSAYARFVQDSGFDYTRDLDQLGLALRGDPAHPVSACALLEGRFPAGFTAYLDRHARRRRRIAGGAAWQFPGFARPQQTMTVALVAPDLLVVTNAANPAPDIVRAQSGWHGAPRLWRAAFWQPRPTAYLAANTRRLAAERQLDGGQPPWAGAREIEVSLRLAPPGQAILQAVEQAGDAAAAGRAQAWWGSELRALGAGLSAETSTRALAAPLGRVRLERSGSRLSATLRLRPGELRRWLAVSAGR